MPRDTTAYRISTTDDGWKVEDRLAVERHPMGTVRYVESFDEALRAIQQMESPCPYCSGEYGEPSLCRRCEGTGIDPDEMVA